MVRPDLADVALAERVFAPHYAHAMLKVIAAAATVRAKPQAAADAVGAVAAGETVEVFDISGGWAWLRATNAIGYLPVEAIIP